ncbi:MAG TPA: SDR family NAD(P)-dependent oxidoreductase [Clostridiaceae bacterium]|jgi:3-oxoacyl-[acyl-carrier protein] reductase|nr:SDR family NAD(P)-dependent oxidoreductase [Clostridiaceae bacterium]
MTKVAIVTGGSRGLGRAMVLRLGEIGYNVVMNYVSDTSKKECEKNLADLREMGVDGLYVQADASDYDQCKKVVDAAIEKFGNKIDVLVNNAGVSNNAPFYQQDHSDYEWLIGVNLFSMMHMTRLVLPYMVEAEEGNIINISSIGGLMGVINQADYCASKSAAIGFTRALALEYAGKNIRVNAICPGMIDTDILKGVNQDELKALAATVPLGKIGDPKCVADAMEYLIINDYTTGTYLTPNGGIHMP